MEKTKYVAFSTQKGGAGKTTLTVLVASYLHYVKGFNVALSTASAAFVAVMQKRPSRTHITRRWLMSKSRS